MRLVRVGGRYLEGREQRLWMALASLLGLATAGILVAVEIPGGRPLYLGVGMVAVLTALRLGGPVTRRLRKVRKGRLGERLVVDLLRGLPDDYWLVNDVTLGLARGNIDHVLIGPCGVVVIETKRFAGRVHCSGDDRPLLAAVPSGARARQEAPHDAGDRGAARPYADHLAEARRRRGGAGVPYSRVLIRSTASSVCGREPNAVRRK